MNTDLPLDEIEEIRELTKTQSVDSRSLTPGECQMARDMADAGDPVEDIVSMFPVDERQLTLHLGGYCDCHMGGHE